MEVKEEEGEETRKGGGAGERGGPASSRKPEEWAAGESPLPRALWGGDARHTTVYGPQFSRISLGLESSVSLPLVTPQVPGVA